MRELQLYTPVSRDPHVVRRLQFVAGGAELVAWVGEPGHGGVTTGLLRVSLGTGESRSLSDDAGYWEHDEQGEPAVSPDGRFLVIELAGGVDDFVYFDDITRRTEAGSSLPLLPLPAHGWCGLVFTPDGAELLAVRNVARTGADNRTRDVVRFALKTYIDPPLRYEDKVNPLTQQPYRSPVYNQRWRAGMTLPPGKHLCAAGLAPDGRLLAAGDVAGGVLVADLKRKKVVASFRRVWPKAVEAHERVATRVAVSPSGEWVMTLANSRLFANPLGRGKAWKSGSAVGAVNDFAVHPSGRFLCAACADGRARYLDPRTGAVAAAFKWANRPRPLYSVAFAPDGLTCAAGTAGGKVFVWDVDA